MFAQKTLADASSTHDWARALSPVNLAVAATKMSAAQAHDTHLLPAPATVNRDNLSKPPTTDAPKQATFVAHSKEDQLASVAYAANDASDDGTILQLATDRHD